MHRIAPEEIAPALFLGQILDAAGRSGEAIPYLRSALANDPASEPIRALLAEALQRADSLEGARREATKLLHDHPRSAAALSVLAMVERGEGHPEEARKLLESASGLAPADATILLRLGVVEAESGRLAEARRHMMRALEIRPGDPMMIKNLRALDALEARQGKATARP
jgi:Flp pilus assembly protein TadD